MSEQMNRQQRRNYIKRLNTPEKLEGYISWKETELRKYYEKEYKKKSDYLVKKMTEILLYTVDCELERENVIRVTARKTKDMNKKIADADSVIIKGVMEQLKNIEEGSFTLEDIETYFKEERELEWEW